MKSVASHPKVKIVALCDVDDNFLADAAQRLPRGVEAQGLARHAGGTC